MTWEAVTAVAAKLATNARSVRKPGSAARSLANGLPLRARPLTASTPSIFSPQRASLPILRKRPLLRSFGGMRKASSVCRKAFAALAASEVKRWYSLVCSNCALSAAARTWLMSSITGTVTRAFSIHSRTPFCSVASQSLVMAAGVPERWKIASSCSATVSPLTVSAMVRPTHSQSPNWIAAPRCDNAASGTRNTTRAFFVPTSMEWSMMATQGGSMGATCLSRPRPTRKVQLITEVKCGTQSIPSNVSVQNSAKMRGTLRKETTACNTSDTHNVRTCRASAKSTRFPPAAGVSAFFLPRPFAPRL